MKGFKSFKEYRIVNPIRCVWHSYSGAYVSTTEYKLSGNNLAGRVALTMEMDNQKHVVWDPAAARRTESNLTKFVNKFYVKRFKRVSVQG